MSSSQLSGSTTAMLCMSEYEEWMKSLLGIALDVKFPVVR